MKKRITMLLLALAMSIGVLALSACNNKKTPPADTTPAEPTGLAYVLLDDKSGYEVKYDGVAIGKNVTIPSTYEKLPVVGIADGGFKDCKEIESVVIPAGIKTIGDNAFNNCSSLKSVSVPGSVTSIGAYAFYNCTKLASASIEESVTSIGKYAFAGCSSLAYTKENNACYLGNSTNKYLFLITTYKPEQGEILSCEINSGTKLIASGAFYNCKTLTSVTIPEGVSVIGENAFDNCTALQSVIIPESVTSINTSAFSYCSTLNSVTIPGTVKSIGSFAFIGCSALENVTVPSGVESIGSYAFADCSSLASISLPDTVESIGRSAFSGCTVLAYNKHSGACYLGSGENDYHFLVKPESEAIEECEINRQTVIISDSAFEDCGELKSLMLYDGIEKIGDSAFRGCTIRDAVISAKHIELLPKKNLQRLAIWDGESIEDDAFAGCENLLQVIITNPITSIGKNAFKGCTSLTTLAIADSVTKIGEGAFAECPINEAQIATNHISAVPKDVLKTVTLISGESIDAEAFKDCAKLTSVVIPDSVEIIGANAFKGCAELTSIVIPAGVTEIGASAFEGCAELTINAAAASKPEGWNEKWNPDDLTVTWSYTA